MARHKEFDRDRALDDAMGVFWEKGYEATSIQDLVDAIGVNRASLYGTFGGKRELFQSALERFRNADEHNPDRWTAGVPPGLARIREVFRRAARETLADARGCMVMNSVAERSTVDADVCGLGKSSRQRIEKFFAACLEQAREKEELPPGKDLRALARYLTNALFGLRMMAKMQPTRKLVADIVATTLSALA
jgi:TetR/AcrR family transcriptional regulator, transcriptional repressor for nem operon